MSKHTPGPWKMLPLEDGVEYLRIRGTQLGKRYKVCNVHAPFQHIGAEVLESQANARLIAAAPMLLEALEEITADYADRFDLNSPSTNPGIKSTIKQARAAIAAAKGE